ncbi:hypothetical protein B0H14DRAFT_2678749 [Mycena olivaceomarginata]|nr:hypothetical protein B0H14DRAFT_2678749 [Mycena olivaceomarginata]
MSDHSLPDEIISEILSPALKVSDEIFSDTNEVSPFAKYAESTSAYLLVSKSWLRVSTPLLYNVVILRSKAQAKALSLALAGNKVLGTFIKKLRVEGGYGAPMLTILQSSPNISDLFVSLEIYSSDNTNGLCKGLSLLNPNRLILWDLSRTPPRNKMVLAVVGGSGKINRPVGPPGMPSLVLDLWPLTCFFFQVVFDCPFVMSANRAKKVISPLIKSRRLHTLAIPHVSASLWAYDTFKECPLKAIHIKKPLEQYQRNPYLSRFKMVPKLMALLKFTDMTTRALDQLEPGQLEPALELPFIAPSLTPSFTPLAGAPEDVDNKVWARVLHFAMSVPELANGVKSKDVPRRLPLLLVSKKFHRLGLSSYYVHVVLRRSSALTKFASVLSSNLSIGPHVRSLVAAYWAIFGESSDSEDEPDTSERATDPKRSDADLRNDAMLAILSRTTGLVRFGGRKVIPDDLYASRAEEPISWDAFEAMVQCSGSTLRECVVRVAVRENALSSATIFDGFTVLRTLAWDSRTAFQVANAPANGLKNLEELRITSTSSSFLVVLSRMKLQSLRRLALSGDGSGSETLLKAHGPKLTDLNISGRNFETLGTQVFELCPNLCSLSIFGYDAPNAESFDPPRTFTTLVKIVFDVPDYWGTTKNLSKDEVVKWERSFVEFEPDNFPGVREITAHSCVWPTKERDIAKSPWVRWAEMMLERNINLLDTAGTKWRPRLKIK